MTILCQVCGTTNLEGTTYCEGCGVELSAAPVPAPAAPHEFLPQETSPQELVAQERSMEAQEVGVTSDVVDPAQADTTLPNGDSESETALVMEAAGEETAPTEESSVETGSEMPTAEATEIGSSASEPVPAAPLADGPSAAPVLSGEAKLGIKKFGAPTGEFIPLQGERLVVGRFDASSGPVDIDLSGLGGQEHISRRHAELYREDGRWVVRDLGSTNGVYVKRKGETSFSPRLQEPAPLADGDELAFGNLMLMFHQS